MTGASFLSRHKTLAVTAVVLCSLWAAGWLVLSGALEPARAFLEQHPWWRLDAVLVFILAPSIALAVLSRLEVRSLQRASVRRLRERDQARRLALCDPLTGLLNRRGLDQALADLPPAPRRVILIDIDDFKSVNDLHGHAVGDAILQTLATRLADLGREHGLIAARLGGDEMVVVAPGGEAFGRTLEQALSQPLRCKALGQIETLVSVGSAELGTEPFTAALARADATMYEAKRHRRASERALDSTRMFEAKLSDLTSTSEQFCVIAIAVNRAGATNRMAAFGHAGALTRHVGEALSAAYPHLPTERLANDVIGVAMPFALRNEVTDLLQRLDVACDLDGQTQHARLTLGRSGAKIRLELREAVEQAQLALENARRGRRSVADFDDADRLALRANMELLQGLREAISIDALELRYQPKLNLRTNTVDSLEALMRWNHPERGFVSPGHFIPLAEDSGDIRAVTNWAFSAACRDSVALQAQGHKQPIYVNVSATLVADKAFVTNLIAEARSSGARLGIEVTETACLQQPEQALANLQRLADAEFPIAIDDYGVGLSSLTYLRQMPASELKIDMSFIRNLSESHRDPLIVRSTIDLAHALDMKVTAEGVEGPETLALLRVMGCDYVQGFEIAPALVLEECMHMLRDGISHQSEVADYISDLRRFITPIAISA